MEQIESLSEIEYGELYSLAGKRKNERLFRPERNGDSILFRFRDGWTENRSVRNVELTIENTGIYRVDN